MLLPRRCCSEEDKERLQYLYDEWAHPYFVSIEAYERIMKVRAPAGGQAGPISQSLCRPSAHLALLVGHGMQPWEQMLYLCLMRGKGGAATLRSLHANNFGCCCWDRGCAWCARRPAIPQPPPQGPAPSSTEPSYSSPLLARALHAAPARCALLQATGKLDAVGTDDWTVPTIDSWRHSVWVGVWDPWVVVFKGPRIWYKTMREIVTLERMHRAFADGLMT